MLLTASRRKIRMFALRPAPALCVWRPNGLAITRAASTLYLASIYRARRKTLARNHSGGGVHRLVRRRESRFVERFATDKRPTFSIPSQRHASGLNLDKRRRHSSRSVPVMRQRVSRVRPSPNRGSSSNFLSKRFRGPLSRSSDASRVTPRFCGAHSMT